MYYWLILTGLIAGIFSGLIGIGGGIVLVPMLVYLLGFSQHKAQGTTLALFMFPVGFLAVWNYYQKGAVNFTVVLWLAIGFVAGAWLGSTLALYLPEVYIKKFFGILMLYVAIKLLFGV